jgi:hypothetical protein
MRAWLPAPPPLPPPPPPPSDSMMAAAAMAAGGPCGRLPPPPPPPPPSSSKPPAVPASPTAPAALPNVVLRGVRALLAPKTPPPQVDALLVRDALQSLSFANKAGLLVTGFGKVEAALSGARAPAIWIEAADGAEDGRRKLMQAMRRRHGDHSSAVPIADCFDSHDLGLALGRELVIHAALKDGAASGAFLDRWRRLVHFRTRPLPQAAMPAGADEFQKDVTAGPTSE